MYNQSYIQPPEKNTVEQTMYADWGPNGLRYNNFKSVR